jgi:hypothetical protein
MDTDVQRLFPIVLNIDAKDQNPEDSDWQNECHQLYVQLKDALYADTIESRTIQTESSNDRGDFIELFNTITAGIASIGGLSLIVDVIKIWLERRKGAEITLKFPDGSEMKISRASKEDILSLYEKQIGKR